MKDEDIIYALCVEDLQAVSKVVYGKKLSKKQLEIVVKEVEGYFSDWFDKVEMAIDNSLDLEKLEEPDWDEYPY